MLVFFSQNTWTQIPKGNSKTFEIYRIQNEHDFSFSFSLLLWSSVILSLLLHQATAQPYNVGFVDHLFHYLLSDEVCMKVKAIDCEVSSQRIRNTNMRIYFPTLEAEAAEPDKYICKEESGASREERSNFCEKDVVRVMGTENAVPALQSDGQGFSVIMFSPGDSFKAAIHYTGLVRSLVQRGFVVVALSHPLIDFTVRLDGDFTPRNDKMAETRGNQLLLESNDAIAALDQLEELVPSFSFDFSRGVGYMGHSLGGTAAMMASIDDPQRRISAVVNFDGIMDWRNPLLCIGSLFAACWGKHPRNLGAEMNAPWMVVAANNGAIGGEVQRQYDLMFKSTTRPKPANSLGFFLKKTGHHSFQDQCHAFNKRPFLCGDIASLEEQDQVDHTLSAYTAAFFELHLQNNDSARDVLTAVDENVIGNHIYVHGDGNVIETNHLPTAVSSADTVSLLPLHLGSLGVVCALQYVFW